MSAFTTGMTLKWSRIVKRVEEADETVLWLELISDGRLLPADMIKDLLAESNEITAIMVASRKSASSGN